MNTIIECTSCSLPVKDYKQNTQERDDLCENCYIVNSTDDLLGLETYSDNTDD